MTQVTGAQVDRVVGKIQALYDELAEEDKPVLRAILLQAAEGPELEGYASPGGGLMGSHRPLDGVTMDLGPSERVTFTFGEIRVIYQPQKPDGT